MSVVKTERRPSWSSLKTELSTALIDALHRNGFISMMPVQAAAIPRLLSNQDVAVQACTGSGKTLAFLVPIIESLIRLSREQPLRACDVCAIVVAPTRELAHQIYDVLQRILMSMCSLTSHTNTSEDNEDIEDIEAQQIRLKEKTENKPTRISLDTIGGKGSLGALLLVGGVSTEYDAQQFVASGANIIVATPGRLQDTLCSGKRLKDLCVRRLQHLVLDEADRLLDLGFETSLNTILRHLPKQRRTGLFSATQTHDVERLVRAGLRNPARIDVRISPKAGVTQLTPLTLRNSYRLVSSEQRLAELVSVLCNGDVGDNAIVFVLTCAMVDYLGTVLQRLTMVREAQLQILPLHGKMRQSTRDREINAFRKRCSQNHCENITKICSVLVCTDVIARGIDVSGGVARIVQYEAPQDPAYFVHRVGRTARMGNTGEAIVMLEKHEEDYVALLRQRGVPLVESVCVSTPNLASDMTRELRAMALADRDIMEKGQRALVSQVRAYTEHLCKYIFQIDNVELFRVATAMGILFLPRMPELKATDRENFIRLDVDPNSIKFADKAREKQRQDNMQAMQLKKAAEKKSRLHKKRLALKKEKQCMKQRRKRKRSETQDFQAQWNELALETTQFRRLKKGKISKREFEVSVGERAASSSTDKSTKFLVNI